MKRFTVQVKLADYQTDWRDDDSMPVMRGDSQSQRKMVWTDMHETDDATDAEERMYGYRRRNYLARVIDNEHPSRT